jgi:hypothetical protein
MKFSILFPKSNMEHSNGIKIESENPLDKLHYTEIIDSLPYIDQSSNIDNKVAELLQNEMSTMPFNPNQYLAKIPNINLNFEVGSGQTEIPLFFWITLLNIIGR